MPQPSCFKSCCLPYPIPTPTHTVLKFYAAAQLEELQCWWSSGTWCSHATHFLNFCVWKKFQNRRMFTIEYSFCNTIEWDNGKPIMKSSFRLKIHWNGVLSKMLDKWCMLQIISFIYSIDHYIHNLYNLYSLEAMKLNSCCAAKQLNTLKMKRLTANKKSLFGVVGPSEDLLLSLHEQGYHLPKYPQQTGCHLSSTVRNWIYTLRVPRFHCSKRVIAEQTLRWLLLQVDLFKRNQWVILVLPATELRLRHLPAIALLCTRYDNCPTHLKLFEAQIGKCLPLHICPVRNCGSYCG